MAEEESSNGSVDTDETRFEARIVSQYIRDLSFESPSIDRAHEGPGENPNLELEVNVNARSIGNNMFRSEIEFRAHAVDDKGTIYLLEATYGGVFQVGPINRDAIEPFLLVNCPSMLFPFLRRLVADLTREGGFPPLFLDPIDFGALYLGRKQRQEAGEPGAGPPSGNALN